MRKINFLLILVVGSLLTLQSCTPESLGGEQKKNKIDFESGKNLGNDLKIISSSGFIEGTISSYCQGGMLYPLPGVSVTIKHKSYSGTLTGENGYYKIGNVSTYDTLVFSHLEILTTEFVVHPNVTRVDGEVEICY